MKRVRRILFNTLTAISLLLAIATMGLWARSGFCIDEYAMSYVRIAATNDVLVRYGCVQSGQGAIRVQRINYLWPASTKEAESLHASGGWHAAHNVTPFSGLSAWQRFTLRSREFHWTTANKPTVAGFDVELPYWTVLAAGAAVPMARLYKHLRKRRLPPGHCPVCGYDMRANPAKRSECGHEASAIETLRR